MKLMMRKLRINRMKYVLCIVCSQAIEFSKADEIKSNKVVIYENRKDSFIFIHSTCSYCSIDHTVRKFIFASRHIDMLTVCKDLCEVSWSSVGFIFQCENKQGIVCGIDPTLAENVEIRYIKANFCDKWNNANCICLTQ